jgi:hypothetical protein
VGKVALAFLYYAMTTLNRNNIPASITTLEGLAAWAVLTYTAAYGGKNYGERDSTDLQRFSRFSIAPVDSKENGSNLYLIARLAIPVNNNLLASGTIAWQGVVEHSQQAVLPAGYTV